MNWLSIQNKPRKVLFLVLALCISLFVVFTGCTQTAPSASGPSPVGTLAQTVTVTPVSISSTSVAATTGVSGSASPAPTIGTSGKTQKYTNVPYAFSLNYPADWEVNDRIPKIDTPNGLPGKIDVVDFYSPSITRCNSEGHDCKLVRAQLTVDVDEHPGTSDVSDYYVRDVARLSTDYPIQITKSNAQTQISGEKALRLDYQLSSDLDIKVIRVYTIINGKAYIINFHSHNPATVLDQKTHEMIMEPDMLEKYLGAMEDSLKSFTVGEGKLSTL